MSSEYIRATLQSLSEWTDGLLALGWMSVGDQEIEEAESFAASLRGLGLETLETQLETFTSHLRSKQSIDDIARAETFGRFLIALEMTRESAQLALLKMPGKIDD